MMPDKENEKKETDDCVVHDHPVPPEELGRYSIERDPYSESDIASYVRGETPDEKIQHIELVKKKLSWGGYMKYGMLQLILIDGG